MRICIYGAASPTIDAEYTEKVELLGEKLAKRGHSLVFGGGANGLMGAAARGIKKQGGHIIGVIPKFFGEESVEAIFEECDELITPDTMRERKQIMEDNSDAFIVVPGGIGTFEEFFEILTLKQLCRHNKPIAIYNMKKRIKNQHQNKKEPTKAYSAYAKRLIFVRNFCYVCFL